MRYSLDSSSSGRVCLRYDGFSRHFEVEGRSREEEKEGGRHTRVAMVRVYLEVFFTFCDVEAVLPGGERGKRQFSFFFSF